MTETKASYQTGIDSHVLMFSGGLDSYLALLTLLDNGINPKLVYVQHGSKNDEEQLKQAKRLAVLHGKELIVDGSLSLGGWERENAFIPNRNGFLAFVGALYGNRIWFAIMDGEQTYDDCKQDTFLAISLSLSKLSGTPVTVDSPFWHLTKAEVIKRLSREFQIKLPLTYSCHKGTDKHCGECSACFRRAVAFQLNNIKEEYITNPFSTELAKSYFAKAEAGHYGKRDDEILKVAREVGY
jgi:7-cyano-7-deazaguanine synthase